MRITQFIVVGAILVGLAVPASSAQVTVTYTGTIDGSVNKANVFGGGALDGLAYKAVYHYDSTMGTPSFSSGPGSSTAIITGGNETASLTVNGITETISAAVFTYVERSFGSLPSSRAEDQVASGTSQIYSYALLGNLSIPASLDTAFTADFSSVINNFGSFSFSNYATSGYLLSDSLVVSVSGPLVSPVPLPASLPLFGAAVVGLAVVSYGRKSRPAAMLGS